MSYDEFILKKFNAIVYAYVIICNFADYDT